MANEITHNATTGLTLYFCAFQQDGDVFLTGGASDEVWGTGARTADDYDEAMTEEASCGHYKGSVAAGVGAGVYQVVIYLQAGANPADSDVAIAQGEIYWDGTAEVNTYTLSETDIAAIIAKLPTNYIMGSSDQNDHDTDIDDILVDTGTTLDDHLTDIKGTGFVKDTDSLVDLAHTGADSDTLETLSDQIDNVEANTGKVVNVYSTTGTKKTIVAGSTVGVVEDEKE